MSQFDIILSQLKIKGIVADPSQPDTTTGEFKGKSVLIQHKIQCDPHAQFPDCKTQVIEYGFKSDLSGSPHKVFLQ